jgi:alkaline phosphatase D
MILKETTRRRFLSSVGAVGGFAAAGLAMPFYARGSSSRPVFTSGVQSGDVDVDSGVIWARVDRPSRLFVEYSTTDKFANAVRLASFDVTPDTDLAGKVLLDGLPPDQEIFYRFVAADLQDINSRSEPIRGQFRTAPSTRRDISFVWSGDTAGQGWGIDDEGMRTYRTIAYHRPDFMIHSGDTIYADNPIPDEIRLRDGGIWKNRVVTDEKRTIAQTLSEFRGQWKYNLLDEHVTDFNAVCPVFYQWDDHEVLNNWSPSTDLSVDDRYKEKSVSTLAARASRAFHEMTPIRYVAEEPGRIYRKVSYGPLLDIFFVDLRSYRGPNTNGLDGDLTPQSRLFGEAQVAWLKRELIRSTATWKVIAADMPLSVVSHDAVALGNGAPVGRELEIADLLAFIKQSGIRNTVWLTADVHYTAAHYYDPNKAAFQDFEPFWEFVSGPIHAGCFPRSELDGTFGPQLVYAKAPTREQGVNQSPATEFQFFGHVAIDGATAVMTVTLKDIDDRALWSTKLEPKPG